ncbi:MAG: insulinase family protein [Bacteroidetes bacterium]|nr:MAG: insulinase family protein [Bacteroidota bacterium]
MLNRITPPPVRPLSPRTLPAYREAALSNGIPVYWIPHGQVEVAEVMMVFRAGDSFQPKPGLADYTAKMMAEGTASYTSTGLARKLDDHGAWLSHETDMEFISLNLTSLERHLPDTLPLMHEVGFTPTFPEAEFQKMKQRNLQKQRVTEQKTGWLARRHFGPLLFGPEHPYGKSLGLPEIEAIQYEDLAPYHQRYFQAGNAFFAVSGRFDEHKLLALLDQTFGGLPYTGANKEDSSAKDVPFVTQTGRHYVEKEGLQSTIRLGHIGKERSHPDYYPMEVVNTILGGYFGSRLMRNIREEKGFTYGISSNLVSFRNDGYFLIGTDVKKEVTQATLDEIRKEINILQTQPVLDHELDTVKNFMAGEFVGSLNTPFEIADRYKTILLDGLPTDFLSNYVQNLRAVSAEQIQKMAQSYLNDEVLMEVVVGGK